MPDVETKPGEQFVITVDQSDMADEANLPDSSGTFATPYTFNEKLLSTKPLRRPKRTRLIDEIS